MALSNKFIVYFLFFLIITAIGLTFFMYYMLSSDGGKCMSNPLNYAKEKIEQANNIPIFCECREEIEEFELDLENLKGEE